MDDTEKRIKQIREKAQREYEYLTIEPAKYDDGVTVKGHARCKNGVLKGQMMKSYVLGFGSVDEAKKFFPEASVGQVDHNHSYHHLPPDNDPPVGNRGMTPGGQWR